MAAINNIEMCRMLEILLNLILGQTVSDAFHILMYD